MRTDLEFQKAVRKKVFALAFHCGKVIYLPTIKGRRKFMICGVIDPNGRPNLKDYCYTLVGMEDWPEDGRRILLAELVARGLEQEDTPAGRALDALEVRCAGTARPEPGTYDVCRLREDTEDDVPF